MLQQATDFKVFTPRDYQKEALNKAREAFRQGYRNILIQQWTGTGKTVLMQNLVYDALKKGNKILFLVPRDFLVDNLADYLNKKDYGIVQTGRSFDYSKQITIALVPSLHAQIKKNKVPSWFKPQLIVLDEVQHLPATSWKSTVEYFGSLPRIGLTATPERLDGKPLKDYFEKLITTHPLRWFINQNYLSDFKVYGASYLAVDFKKKAGEYDLAEQAKVYDNPTILGKVVDFWTENFLSQKSIYFCASIEHSKHLAEEFNQFGRRYYGRDIAIHIDGKTDKRERKKLLDRFAGRCDKKDELMILVNVNLFIEGLNVPECRVVGLCRKTASISVLLQAVGRGLRYEPNKVCSIIDHVGVYEEHPLPDANIQWSLEGRIKDKKDYVFNCFNCGTNLSNDYREFWDTGKEIVYCECGCLNRVPKKKSRDSTEGYERKGYDHDESAKLVLLESNAILFEINKIVKKGRELEREGKKGKGFAIYRLRDLFLENKGISFDDLKYGLVDGLGYSPGFALKLYQEWKKEL